MVEKGGSGIGWVYAGMEAEKEKRKQSKGRREAKTGKRHSIIFHALSSFAFGGLGEILKYTIYIVPKVKLSWTISCR